MMDGNFMKKIINLEIGKVNSEIRGQFQIRFEILDIFSIYLNFQWPPIIKKSGKKINKIQEPPKATFI